MTKKKSKAQAPQIESSKPKAHARFAASNSSRWIACPGSLELSDQAPEQVSGAAADEGTLAHDLMELALLAKAKDVKAFAKTLPKKYPADMVGHVQGFVDFVWSQMKPGYELLVEERIELDFLHPTDAFGTVDVAIIEPFGLLHIIDFKYGRGFVDHNDNSQMIYYGLGLAHKHGYDFEQVKTTIYQPRVEGEVHRSSFHTIQDLKVWSSIFKQAIQNAETADLTTDLKPGDHCKWCPAKIICPEISKKSLSNAKLDFDSPVLPSPVELKPEQMKELLSRAHYLELWISEVKSYAIQKLKKGQRIPGWSLVPTRAQRVWNNPSDLILEWPKSFDGKKISPYKQELKTPPQVEKELKAAKVKKETIEGFLKDYVSHVSSGVTLEQQTTDYASTVLETRRRH